MDADTNPLASLIAEDNQNIDLSKLTKLLTDRVIFSKTGEITYLEQFHAANNQQRVLIMLTANKAQSILFDHIVEGLAPGKIIEQQVMPEGSVKSTLKYLLEKSHEIRKNQEGYYVPNYVLNKLEARLAPEKSS